MQIKTTMRCHITSIRIANTKREERKRKENVSKDVERLEPLMYCWQDCKIVEFYGKQYGGASKIKNRTTT